MHWRSRLHQARQKFRLTSAEKRVVTFVLAAFVLGLVTKCYRDAHPSPAPSRSDRGKTAACSHTYYSNQSNQPVCQPEARDRRFLSTSSRDFCESPGI